MKSNQIAHYECPSCKREVGFKPFGVAYNHEEGDRKMLLLQCGGPDCDALLAIPHPLK